MQESRRTKGKVVQKTAQAQASPPMNILTNPLWTMMPMKRKIKVLVSHHTYIHTGKFHSDVKTNRSRLNAIRDRNRNITSVSSVFYFCSKTEPFNKQGRFFCLFIFSFFLWHDQSLRHDYSKQITRESTFFSFNKQRTTAREHAFSFNEEITHSLYD